MQPYDVLAKVELDIVVGAGCRLDKIPEAKDIVGQSRLPVHRDNRAAAALREVAVGGEHSRFNEHRLGSHIVDLSRALLRAVAQVAENKGGLLFEDCR